MKYLQAKKTALILLAGGLLLTGCTGRTVPESAMVQGIAAAVYPEWPEYPGDEAAAGFEQRYDAWRETWKKLRNQPDGYRDGLDDFSEKVIRQFMMGSGTENRVFSPLSLYSALAMTAESAAGESREQILNLLGYEDTQELRQNAKAIWESNYTDDGATVSILSNSLWMNDSVRYNVDTLKNLADSYYASSYIGRMGSEEYDTVMRNWLNTHTGGLLTDAAESETMTEDTVLSLISAVNFSARWMGEFNPANTESGTFHGANGDETAEFMKFNEMDDYYYWADDFAAYCMDLENTGGVWFVLPDEGVTPDEVLAGEDFYRLIFDPMSTQDSEWENQTYIKINLAVPKFKVQSELDLTDGLCDLGVTDIFSADDADFSPLTVDYTEPVWLDQAKQAVTVEIDEEGITAAAYTKMRYYGAPPPPEEVVDFICDRPFVFAVLGNDDLPMFIGVVNTVN